MEQETALEACFAALESESPVGKSRIAGKISSDDLSLALKSLVKPPDQPSQSSKHAMVP